MKINIRFRKWALLISISPKMVIFKIFQQDEIDEELQETGQGGEEDYLMEEGEEQLEDLETFEENEEEFEDLEEDLEYGEEEYEDEEL